MKKIISLILAVLMLFTIMCLPVMATSKPNVIIDNGSGYTKSTKEIQKASTISEGNIWIIVVVGAVAVIAVAAVVISKKKKKAAVAETVGEVTETEEKEE